LFGTRKIFIERANGLDFFFLTNLNLFGFVTDRDLSVHFYRKREEWHASERARERKRARACKCIPTTMLKKTTL
jgi:hypothetical protein